MSRRKPTTHPFVDDPDRRDPLTGWCLGPSTPVQQRMRQQALVNATRDGYRRAAERRGRLAGRRDRGAQLRRE